MDFDKIVSLVSLFVGVGSLLFNLYMDKYQKANDEHSLMINEASQGIEAKVNREFIESRATEFIQKYNNATYPSEINLLPLCAMARTYNKNYNYHRKMYKDFCVLPKSTQDYILERRKVYPIQKSSINLTDYCLNKFETILNDFEGDNQIFKHCFYGNGKYFKYAIRNFNGEHIPSVDVPIVKPLPCLVTNTTSIPCYINYLIASDSDDHDIYIKRLVNIFQNANSIIKSYICCELIIKFTINKFNRLEFENRLLIKYDDYIMEDLFLMALYYLCIYSTEH